MTLNYVTLIIDGFDAGGDQLAGGSISFAPSIQLSDPTDHEWIPPAPVGVTFRAGLASPQVSLLATDNSNVLPNGWGWTVTFSGVSGAPAPFSFFLPYSSGATQYLSAQQPTESVVTMAAYLPQPSGTATAGYVPVATGNGEASVWGPNGTGGSGYPTLPAVSGTPSAGQVLTATSATAADWQTPSGGGGGINPPAGDIGGTASAPTVVSTHLSSALPLAQGGTGQASQQAAMDALAGAQTAGDYLRGNGTHVVLAAIQAGDVPTLNQNTTGTAAGLSSTLAIGSGGTGQVTQQAALNALAGAQTSGDYLRGNGTNVSMSAIQAGDVPTLNQNTTGTAANITDTLDQVPAPAANVSLNSHKVTNLANGSAASDAAAYGQTLAGGDGAPLTTLGDILYENSTPAPARLAGNTSATKNFLTQTGTGSASAAPAWGTIAAGDVPTLNQNTTGSSGSCTGNAATATNLAGGATLPDYLAPNVVALTFVASGTTTVNAALGNSFNLTLTASTTTLGNPSNPVDGQVIRFRITQGTGGSFTLAYGGNYDFGAAGAPTLSTAAAKVDILGFEYVGSISKWCYLGSGLGF